jgi:hypothetical protein
MRVACVDKITGKVINVIIVESLDKVPDIVGVNDETGQLVRKEEVDLIETQIGSKDDVYIAGEFYRRAGR